jgi:hypothetical protein
VVLVAVVLVAFIQQLRVQMAQPTQAVAVVEELINH